MLFTRIKRGAVRASLLVQNKLATNRVRINQNFWRSGRAVLLNALVVRTVLMPVPLAAPATAVAAGPEDAEPSPRLVRVSVETQQALTIARTEDLNLSIATDSLNAIQVGTSVADVRAAEEAAKRQAEEAARKAEAAKKAAAQNVTVRVANYGDGEIQQIIREAAAKYGVDANLMLAIAKCESGFNPSARNKQGSSASGLFQFMPRTYSNSPQARAGLSIFDARANAEAAAYKIANGGLRAWNASKRCWSR